MGWMDGWGYDVDEYDVTVLFSLFSFLLCFFLAIIFCFLFLYYNEAMQGHVGSCRAQEPRLVFGGVRFAIWGFWHVKREVGGGEGMTHS